MKTQPLITIITVVYNLINAQREKQFRQCLESVNNQSYTNIEHLIIDGASTDGTIDLIKEYADKGWVKYISEPDKGLYDAMNKGANLAQGEYLAFLNSDDFYSDLNGIEKCIKKLVKTNADFSYAKANIISEYHKKKELKNHLYVKPDLSKVFTDMPFSHQALIVKTSVFKNLGMYNLQYRSASDYEFILKMIFNKCTHIYCNCKLATFRVGGFSLDNAELSHNEIASFYTSFYSDVYTLNIEEAKNIYLKKALPMPIIKKVLRYLSIQNRIKLLFNQGKNRNFLKKLQKSIIQFKFGKNEKYLTILGKKIV